MPAIDLTGQRYGRLLVLERMPRPLGLKASHAFWNCICDCGEKTAIKGNHLRSGSTTSCGCYRAEHTRERKTKHGFHTRAGEHPLYRCWQNMKTRCLNPKGTNYKDYGGRGIAICDKWMEFEPFKDFALANGWAPGLQIDRINNDGDYEPSNVRFVTPAENTAPGRRRSPRKAA